MPLSQMINELTVTQPDSGRSFCTRRSPHRFTLSPRRFIPYLQQLEPEYSIEELECRVSKLVSERCSDNGQISLRELLFFFSDQLIHRYHERWRFAYKYCDIWRDTVLLIDEEYFVAAKTVQENKRRNIFTTADYSWSYSIEHDNTAISKMLNSGEGVSDNHFHLRCSSPYYQFSWISMMSNPADSHYVEKLEAIEQDRLYPRISLDETDHSDTLPVLWIKAAAIRLFLAYHLESNHKVRPGLSLKALYAILQAKEIDLQTPMYLQKLIDQIRFRQAQPAQMDYIPAKNDGGLLFDLYGERQLLCELLCSNHDRRIEALLFLYLAIKTRFRSELVQCNTLIGFDNFKNYQSRKDWFLDGSDETERKLVAASVASVIDGPRIHSLEMRISPAVSGGEKTATAGLENIRYIRLNDQAIRRVLDHAGNGYRLEDFYYTLSFPKFKEYYSPNSELFCRYYKFRECVAKGTEGILDMQEMAPDVATRVRGIDACNEEILCRPEVFGPSFRRLQYYNSNREIPQLQVTYHVAEHNYDIVDGLRAVHEAILFLGLRSGSRLGHATLLGVPAVSFYREKGMSLNMPLQNYIDNLVWMYFFMLRNLQEFSGAQIILDFIRNKYYDHIKKLFGDDRGDGMYPTIDEYNMAWLLRGDEPQLYRNPDIWKEPKSYDAYMLCHSIPEMDQARSSKRIRRFYHLYHYDRQIRQNAQTAVCEAITAEMAETIGKIQNAMKKMIAEKEIGIECNPSSNLLIGPISGYEQHPIREMFDKGLGHLVPGKTQLNVSVNTDDKRVFSTSISNEYAYLAFSLEHLLTEDHEPVYGLTEIYDWLDLLRRNGNAQSFTNLDHVPHKVMMRLLQADQKKGGRM